MTLDAAGTDGIPGELTEASSRGTNTTERNQGDDLPVRLHPVAIPLMTIRYTSAATLSQAIREVTITPSRRRRIRRP